MDKNWIALMLSFLILIQQIPSIYANDDEDMLLPFTVQQAHSLSNENGNGFSKTLILNIFKKMRPNLKSNSKLVLVTILSALMTFSFYFGMSKIGNYLGPTNDYWTSFQSIVFIYAIIFLSALMSPVTMRLNSALTGAVFSMTEKPTSGFKNSYNNIFREQSWQHLYSVNDGTNPAMISMEHLSFFHFNLNFVNAQLKKIRRYPQEERKEAVITSIVNIYCHNIKGFVPALLLQLLSEKEENRSGIAEFFHLVDNLKSYSELLRRNNLEIFKNEILDQYRKTEHRYTEDDITIFNKFINVFLPFVKDDQEALIL